MERIQFENPALLHLLWLLLIQVALIWYYWRWRERTLNVIGTPQLEKRLLLGFSQTRFWWKNGLFSMILILTILAISNPQKLERIVPKPNEYADIIIALDVSRSMLATDISPNRLERAKDFVRNLIKSQSGNHIGLVFFAGDAFPQSPLTNDPSSLLLFLSNAYPDAVNNQGTNLGSAIEQATRMFTSDTIIGKAIVLVSDGEDQADEDIESAVIANREGVVIHTVSVGTVGGGTIPVSMGRGLLRDYEGNVVRTSVRETKLKAISGVTNGVHTSIDNAAGTEELEDSLTRLNKTMAEQQTFTVFVSYYQWFLIPAIFLLIIDQLLFWKK